MSSLRFLEQIEISKALMIMLMLILVSAIAVIITKHKSRNTFVQLQRYEKARDHLNEEWGRLLLEESTWASPARVEQEAKSRLNMIIPPNDMTVVIKP